MPTHKSGQAFTELVFISSDNQYTPFFFFLFLIYWINFQAAKYTWSLSSLYQSFP